MENLKQLSRLQPSFVKDILLKHNIVFQNEYLDKYIELISREGDSGNNIELHHIVPVKVFDLTNTIIDNNRYNLIPLTRCNHILAHYYLFKCALDPKFRRASALAVYLMLGGNRIPEEEQVFLESLVDLKDVKVAGFTISEETRRRLSASKKGQLEGYVWVTRGNEEYMIPPEYMEEYLDAGFDFGRSEMMKKRCSESRIGKCLGDSNPSRNPEVRRKISQVLMGHETSDETRRKIGEAQRRLRGSHYYNNGIKCIKAFECPEGYVKGKLKLVKDGK